MKDVSIFRAVAALAMNAMGNRKQEQQEFLSFLRELVESVPEEVTREFGTLSGIKAVKDGTEHDWGIMLNVTDYLWWKDKFEQGYRFAERPERVQAKILARLAKVAEGQGLDAEGRRTLLAILDPKEE